MCGTFKLKGFCFFGFDIVIVRDFLRFGNGSYGTERPDLSLKTVVLYF